MPIYTLRDQLIMKRIRTAARNRSRERVAGMEIETYGTEVGEEFDYDNKDDVESVRC